jgi:hypothetical protein
MLITEGGQRIIGSDAGFTTVGSATEASSNRRLQIPNITGLEALGGPTTGGPLPEANTNPTSVNADNFVRTSNEEGFCPGDCVVINWDRSFKFGRSTKSMWKKKTEGQIATVTKVTPKFVWAVVDGENEPIQKKSHNVSLQTPAVGAETVSIQAKEQPERQVHQRTK